MAFSSGIATDAGLVSGGERSPNTPVVLSIPKSAYEDGLKIGRFCKLDTGSADNFDGSATPTPLGVVLRKIGNAIEDADTYDHDITPQVEILRSGVVTVRVKEGETPALAGRVYIANDGDANDGLATATASDVAVNAEFLREIESAASGIGVWEISLNLPQGDVSTHIADTTGAHAASAIAFTPGGTIAAATVQLAVAEVATDAATALSDHTTDAVGAHAATAISVTPAGGIVATEAQAALVELDGEIDAITPVAIADPGDGNAIPVTDSGWVQLESAVAETRTLADPSRGGVRLDLLCTSHGGDIVLTVAGPVNKTLNNTITFAGDFDFISLRSVGVGPGFVWRVVATDGAALSTVGG